MDRIFNFISLFIIFIILKLFSPILLIAAEYNNLVVENILTEAYDLNLSIAQKKAFLKGGEKAWLVLAAVTYPNLSLKNIEAVKNSKIIEAINGYSIKEELIEEGKYSALITYEFDKLKTNNIIKSLFSFPIGKRIILLIPIFYENGQPKIWETEWWEEWNFRNSPFFKVIQENIEDITFLDLKKLYSQDEEHLQTLLHNYNAEDIVIVEANIKEDNIEVVILQLMLQQKNNYSYINPTFSSSDNLKKIVEDIYKNLTVEYKPNAFPSNISPSSISIIVKGPKAWRKLRDRLLPKVKHKVDYVSKDIIIISIYEKEKLPNLLKKCPGNGLAVEEEGKNHVVLVDFKFKNVN